MNARNLNGRAVAVSMADFNERARKVAAATVSVSKGEPRRAAQTRFRRGPAPAVKVDDQG